MRRHFETLDGLRGAAALVVVTLHCGSTQISALAPGAYLAVDFFFVLSGFVLSHAYEDKLRRGLAPLEFMRLRLVRLWPLYALGSAAGILLMLGDIPWRGAFLASLALAALFIPAAHPRLSADHVNMFPFNFPAWSLSMELIANAVFAVAAPRLDRRMLLALLTVGAVALIATDLQHGHLNVGGDAGELAGPLSRVAYGFFAGVAVHRLWRVWPSRPLPSWLLVAPLVAMLVFPHDLAWTLLGFPILIYFAASSRPTGVARSLLLKLGAISYGVYVLQAPIFEAAAALKLGETPIEAAAVIAVIVAAAFILDAYFDKPARQWLERRTRRRPAPELTAEAG